MHGAGYDKRMNSEVNMQSDLIYWIFYDPTISAWWLKNPITHFETWIIE